MEGRAECRGDPDGTGQSEERLCYIQEMYRGCPSHSFLETKDSQDPPGERNIKMYICTPMHNAYGVQVPPLSTLARPLPGHLHSNTIQIEITSSILSLLGGLYDRKVSDRRVWTDCSLMMIEYWQLALDFKCPSPLTLCLAFIFRWCYCAGKSACSRSSWREQNTQLTNLVQAQLSSY